MPAPFTPNTSDVAPGSVPTAPAPTAPTAPAPGSYEESVALGKPGDNSRSSIYSGPAATPIAVDTMGQKSTPVVIPPAAPITTTTPVATPPPTTTVGTNGAATATPVAPPSDTQSWIKTQFQKLGDALGTKADVTKQLQDANGLDAKTLAATTSYNAYNQAKQDLNNRLESFRTHGGGTTAGNDEILATMEREGNTNLANLAIQAQADQGLLSAAEKTIQNKIDAQFKPVSDQIDFLTKFASVNSNDLTESEKFKLTEAANQKKADLENVTNTAGDIHTSLLQNKAPSSVYDAIDKINNDFVNGKITAADAQSKMYQAAGQYGAKTSANADTQVVEVGGRKVLIDSKTGATIKDLGTMSKGDELLSVNEAQTLGVPYGTTKSQAIVIGSLTDQGVNEKTIAKIQSAPEYKTITGVLPAIQALKSYQDAIDKYGTTESFNGEGKGTLAGTYGNALATWKTLAGLGALSGADFTLAENAVPEIGFFKRVSTSKAKIQSSIDNAINQAENLSRRLSQNYPKAAKLFDAQLDDMKLTAYPTRFTRAPDGSVIEIIK